MKFIFDQILCFNTKFYEIMEKLRRGDKKIAKILKIGQVIAIFVQRIFSNIFFELTIAVTPWFCNIWRSRFLETSPILQQKRILKWCHRESGGHLSFFQDLNILRRVKMGVPPKYLTFFPFRLLLIHSIAFTDYFTDQRTDNRRLPDY